jgi:hypothetical protein
MASRRTFCRLKSIINESQAGLETRNETVMSGEDDPELPSKIDE